MAIDYVFLLKNSFSISKLLGDDNLTDELIKYNNDYHRALMELDDYLLQNNILEN